MAQMAEALAIFRHFVSQINRLTRRYCSNRVRLCVITALADENLLTHFEIGNYLATNS